MHITITGRLGSGKSTVAKLIAEKHNYLYYSTGIIMRDLAREAGLSICDYNKMIENDPTEDRKIDDRTREVAFAHKDKDMVFDSRMAWFFAPNTFKVYVTVDTAVAASRVKHDPRPGEPTNELELYCELEERSRVEQARFIKFYGEGADYYDLNNFNLVVDSTTRSAEEVAAIIWQACENFRADPVAYAHVEIL